MPSIARSQSSHASAHQQPRPVTTIAITPSGDQTPDLDGEFGDVPKVPIVTVIKDLDEPLSPSPEMAESEFKDIGESSAAKLEEVALPPSEAPSVRSQRISPSNQLSAPRSRRTQSVSSSVSRDLERGDVLPRIVHSSVQPASRDSSGSESENSEAPSVYQRPEWNDSSEVLGRRDSANTTSDAVLRFSAFRESRWVRSVVIAKIGFVVMTLIVLGNLVYSYDYPLNGD